MADTFLAEWQRADPTDKALCICGNLHSRLAPLNDEALHFWPSFAAHLQQCQPGVVVKSLDVAFHHGAFFNVTIQPFTDQPIPQAYVSSEPQSGHSLTLHWPTATPATHLAEPQHKVQA